MSDNEELILTECASLCRAIENGRRVEIELAAELREKIQKILERKKDEPIAVDIWE